MHKRRGDRDNHFPVRVNAVFKISLFVDKMWDKPLWVDHQKQSAKNEKGGKREGVVCGGRS